MTNPGLVFAPASVGRKAFERNLRLWRTVQRSNITPPKCTERFGYL